MIKSIGKELNDYSGVPATVFDKLSKDLALCISSAMSDAKQLGEKIVSLNIGIGTLSIDLRRNQYKFIPGKELKTTIKNSNSIKLKDLKIDTATIEKLNKQLAK